jgi:hypothetical protein
LLLGNLLVLFILLVVIEVALRLMNVGFGNTPLNPDPVFHHVHPANYSFVNYSSTGEYEGYEVRFDEEGRVSPAKKRKASQFQQKAVFLGASFVESVQVSWDSSFVGRLQHQFPQTEMLNYGVSSYCPSVHYLVAKHKLLKSEPLPSKAIIMIYSNDVGDDQNYLQTAKFDAAGDLAALDGGKPDGMVTLMRRFYLVRLVKKAMVTLKFAMNKKARPAESAEGVVGSFLEENPDWEGTPSADYLLKTVRLLESKGVKTWVTVVPSKYRHFYQKYEGLEYSEKIERWATANGVPFINLSATFRQWREQGGKKLFFEKDIHFNETGHRVAAKALAAYLN